MVSKEEVDADLPDEITTECSKFGQVVKGLDFYTVLLSFLYENVSLWDTSQKSEKSSNL